MTAQHDAIASGIPGITFRPLGFPTTLGEPGGADIAALTEVRNRMYREINGTDDEDITPEYLLALYQPSPDEDRLVWIVEDGGSAIGRIGVDIPHEDGSRSAYALIELLRSAQGRGIGRAAHALIESAVREAGRSVIQTWAQHNDAPGERLDAPTGFGSIPRDRDARFLERAGYSLEQIERRSALDPRASAAHVDALLTEARAAAPDYRVVTWTLPTPAEHVAGYAHMKERMSTDVPTADLEMDAETWDAERVARHDARYLEGGQTCQVTAAQHVESGELVAYNELVISEDRTRPTSQEDTLVIAEHRGHRLGQLVKCAGLVAWREIAPETRKIITYNAEENRPMLDINERIGFAPEVYIGAWKKVLA